MGMFVCLFDRTTRKPHDQTSPILVHIACGGGLVLLWRRCDTLSTSGFADDVMFSHNGLMVRHVYS